MRLILISLMVCVLNVASAPAARAQAHAGLSLGSIALQLQALRGSEAIDVQGEAPPNAPITITLLAVVSSELPTIVVSRHDLVTDVNGRFGAVIPIASAFERGTLLRVVATSLPGIAPASSQWITNAPNTGVTVP